MDKPKFRKNNGYYVRRIGPKELQSHIMYVIDSSGSLKRAVFPPDDVVDILLNANEPPDVPHPTIEYTYNIKKMTRKHGKPSKTSKSQLKFGLSDFAKLFENEETSAGGIKFPLCYNLMNQTTGEDVPLSALVQEDEIKALEAMLEEEARKKLETLSQIMCQCKKQKVLDEINNKIKCLRLQQSMLLNLMSSYESYSQMLIYQLDRMGYAVALDFTEDRDDNWALVKKDPKTKLVNGRRETCKTSLGD